MTDPLVLSVVLFAAAIGAIVGRAWAGRRRIASRSARQVVPAPEYDALIRARVAVHDRFYLERRGVFVVEGELLEGEVRCGMMLAVPYFESEDVLTGARVEEVQPLAFHDADGRLGLVLGCRTEREAVFWHELIREGQTLDVIDYELES
ncbi:MAG TPA: hypothetical protein VMM18_03910 [Gemmatimonadaceae bacterium]|nr:hypothetical protein [Gemmatimonadaceae bacterium]